MSNNLWTKDDVEILRKSIENILDHTKENVDYTQSQSKLKFRNYQLNTIKFAKHRGSALLALEYALGKTPLSLAYIAELLHSGIIKKALVLAPKPVLWHWYKQNDKFFGNLMNATIIGQGVNPKNGKIKTLNKEERLNQWQRQDVQVFIATYDIIRRDFMDEKNGPDGNPIVNPTKAWTNYWDGSIPYLLIADEVTKIKSHKSQRTKFLKHLPSVYRIGLSGRPLENNLDELYTIMDWIWPGCLGSFSSFKKEHLVTDNWGNVRAYKNTNEFREKLKWIMIRYTTEEIIAELPAITHNVYDVILSEAEAMEYDRIQTEVENEFDAVTSTPNDNSLEHRNHMTSLLAWLTLARMYCDHPLLVKHSDSNSAKSVDIKCSTSSKLEDLMLILDELEGEKIVIFSQFRNMISIIEHAIKARFPGKNVYKIIGGMKASDFQKSIDDFTNDPNGGYFLSTDAGAYGVELNASHYLINYDSHWNPAVMDQRSGRLRRPGQPHPVVVITLSVPDNDKIEARVKAVLSKKQELYHDVIEKLDNAGTNKLNGD
jgi:SNF2 family DNA or RNA helicase